MSKTFQWAAGALIVCRRDAFQDVGGFPLDIYALEEIELRKQLKKWGRQRDLQCVILSKHPLKTSSRKVPLYSPGKLPLKSYGCS